MKDVLVYNANGERLIRLAQWDRDVHICITDADISQAYPVHFFNKNSDQAYVVASTYADGTLKAKIPDLLLREPYTICGYIQRNDGDVERRSDFRFVVSVVPKPQPSDYIARNSPDYLELEDLIANYKELIEQAEQAIKNAEDANNKAASIVNDAQTATQNANAATSAANTATQNANSAAQAANQAATAASNAATAANQSKQNADAAANGANAAATAANNASAAASTAKANADAATEAANSAADAANAAAEAVGDEIDGIIIADDSSGTKYLGKFRIVGTHPALELTKIKEE